MARSILALALMALPTLAQAQQVPAQAAAAAVPEVTAQERARIERILRRTPLIDGHNDLPIAIRRHYDGDLDRIDLAADTSTLERPLHTDIPRLRQGGVGAQFWSVYVPASLTGLENTQAVIEQIDLTRRMIERYRRHFEYAETAADIVRIHRAGRIASMLGMEGGEAINNNLALLREFRRMGVLYMTLTHSANTAWIDSATDAPAHNGLTDFGRAVIAEMNRIGMLVDLSHVSAQAMRDVIAVARAPVIFSHSSAFALTAHPRNVPDDVLELVRANGGVVMVNFNAPFISEAFRQWSALRSGKQAEFRALNPGDAAAAAQALNAWDRANPPPRASAADVADHVEHIARIAGIAHVGLGADYDGVTYLPQGMGGVDGYTLLFAELIRRGWRDADLAALAGGNLLRVLRAAEAVAQAS